ncbi:hypothetical protein TNCV_2160731 [Trichonephila clavipes]|nr:hypothetical protein TNCV_2160731 [Trichonephila clavipes]
MYMELYEYKVGVGISCFERVAVVFVGKGSVEGKEWDICVTTLLSLKHVVVKAAQRAFAVQTYFSNGRSVVVVQRVFRRRFDIPPRGRISD